MTKQNVVPRLVCNVTGNSRLTTREYLDAKLANCNLSEEKFLELYICKDASKLLRKGMTVDEVRKQLKSEAIAKITAEELKQMLLVNGKQKSGGSGPVMSAREMKAREEAAKEAAKQVAKPVIVVPAPAAAKK